MRMPARIMANIGNPAGAKWALLCGIVYSIILYGTPAWRVKSLGTTYIKIHLLFSAQRKTLLRVASVYITVSAATVQIITGTLRIDLMTDERGAMYKLVSSEESVHIRDKFINVWCNVTRDTVQWIKRLILDIRC